MPKVVKISNTYYLSIPSDLVKEMNIQEGDVFSVEEFRGALLYRRVIRSGGSIWV